MYNKCQANLQKIKKGSIYIMIDTILFLIIASIYPDASNVVLFALKLQMGIILFLGFFNLICGLLSKRDKVFNWITLSDADNACKAHLIHCHRVHFIFNSLKAGFVICIAGLIQIAIHFYNYSTIGYFVNFFIYQIYAFALLDACAALLDFSCTIKPWKEYGVYYKMQ